MQKILKRLAICALLTGGFHAFMHLHEHPEPEHIINWATAACGAVCLFYALTWDD